MRTPLALRRLDDRVLSRRRDGGSGADTEAHVYPADPHEDDDRAPGPPRRRRGDGVPAFLSVVWRVSRLVLLGLAAVCALAVAFTLLPTNEDNVVVRTVLDVAEQVAGPFRDVFTADDPERARVYNLALATAVYLLLASVVGRLPTGRRAGQ